MYDMPFEAPSLVLFVAPEGDDERNSGRSVAEPFRTIEHAVLIADIARKAAVLILAPGDYSRKAAAT